MAKHNKANRKAKRSSSDNVNVNTASAVICLEPSASERPTTPERRIVKAEPIVSRPRLASTWQAGEPELIVFEPGRGESIEHKPEPSQPQGAVFAGAEDLDPLTDRALEDGFFAERVDSIAPSADDIELEPEPFVAPAHVLVRREKMRRAVAWTIGFFAVVSIAVVANAMMPRRKSLEAAANPAVNHLAIVSSTSAKEAARSLQAPKPIVPSQGETVVTEALLAPSASVAAPVALVANPLKEALNLLNRGKLEAAISMADLAIEREPGDATAYLYRGAALQDLGRRKQAVEAYSDCVRNATKGPVQECRALGGKK